MIINQKRHQNPRRKYQECPKLSSNQRRRKGQKSHPPQNSFITPPVSVSWRDWLKRDIPRCLTEKNQEHPEKKKAFSNKEVLTSNVSPQKILMHTTAWQ